MSIYQKFVKDIATVAASEAIIKLRPILFLPILTAFLSVADYGVYATLLVTVTFLLPFATLGSEYGIIRFLSAEKNNKKISSTIFSVAAFVLVGSLLMGALMFLSANFLANTVFGDPHSSEAIRIAAAWVPLQALLGVFMNFFIMRQRMLTYSIFNISNALFPTGLGVLSLLLGGGLSQLVYFYAIAQVVLVFASLLVFIKSVGVSMPNLRILSPYLKFGTPLVLGTFSGTILNVGDRYIIGLLMGAAYVGVYSVAYTLGTTLLIILKPISTALLAPASKSYDEERHHEVDKYLSYSIRYFLLLAIPAAVGLSVLSDSLTNSLANPQFLEGAFGVTALVAFSTIFFGIYSINSTILYLRKMVHQTVAMLFVAGVSNIALNLILIPKMGLFGAGLSTLICFMGLAIATCILFKRWAKLSFEPLFIIKCSIAALVMGVIVSYLNPAGWVRIMFATGFGAGLYLLMLFGMGAFRKNEIRVARGLLRKVTRL